jgi:ADP-ribose pyrophosphatase
MDISRPLSKQPIPRTAIKVFTGKLFDVYQWEQELFNGRKITFEKLKRPDTVNIIPVMGNGSIVISQQEQPGTEPFMGCLGGRIDEGENPLEAARRELLEEAGLQAKEWILWDSRQLIDKIDWAIYTFVAKGCQKVQEQSVESGEKIKIKYISFNEFIKIAEQENFRDAEIALKLFQILHNPSKLKEMKKIFLVA